MLTMVTFNLKERERCNGQVSIIDSSHFIIHTITLLCHYDVCGSPPHTDAPRTDVGAGQAGGSPAFDA